MAPAENPPRIPPMNELLAQAEERGLFEHGREACRAACRRALEDLRERLRAGQGAAVDDAFWQEVEAMLRVLPMLRMRGAINATGVVLHTNLGRAPWPLQAQQAAVAASRAAVCEIDLESGGRGRRDGAVSKLLSQVTGAEAGLPVNNNAATVLLAVASLAAGRKVVVARSELVEIGGSYRMPEVVAAAGATMVEVGTTNRAHLHDFVDAMEDPEVAMVLRVHPSNYRIEGFTKAPEMAELAAACRARALPLVFDLGSGILRGAGLQGLEREFTVQQALKAGCDLVTFSGDKLLGGPQAGLIVGARSLVERLRRNMLTRCLRLDKTILAALEAVLSLHALGEECALREVPALRMLAQTSDQVRERCETLRSLLGDGAWELSILPTHARVGSGASPTEDLPSFGVSLQQEGWEAVEIARRLRLGGIPVVARVQDEQVVLDLFAVEDAELPELAQQVSRLARD